MSFSPHDVMAGFPSYCAGLRLLLQQGFFCNVLSVAVLCDTEALDQCSVVRPESSTASLAYAQEWGASTTGVCLISQCHLGAMTAHVLHGSTH